MRPILSLAGIIIALNCAAQQPTLKGKPKLSLRQLLHRNPNEPNANYHKHFFVNLINGRLQVTRQVSSSAKIYPLAGGSLVALNVGEWGGGLYFKPDDTTRTSLIVNQKTVPVTREERYSMLNMFLTDPNFKLNDAWLGIVYGNASASAVTPFNGSLLVGLGYFSFTENEGSLLKVTRTEGGFTTEKLMDLDNVPVAITTRNNKIYIATSKGLIVTESGQIMLRLHWNSARFWINSMAMTDERHIYLGLKNGYAKLDLLKKKLTSYTYYTR
jgi:hypothetical protein